MSHSNDSIKDRHVPDADSFEVSVDDTGDIRYTRNYLSRFGKKYGGRVVVLIALYVNAMATLALSEVFVDAVHMGWHVFANPPALIAESAMLAVLVTLNLYLRPRYALLFDGFIGGAVLAVVTVFFLTR